MKVFLNLGKQCWSFHETSKNHQIIYANFEFPAHGEVDATTNYQSIMAIAPLIETVNRADCRGEMEKLAMKLVPNVKKSSVA